jgi:hypothetical protein
MSERLEINELDEKLNNNSRPMSGASSRRGRPPTSKGKNSQLAEDQLNFV